MISISDRIYVSTGLFYFDIVGFDNPIFLLLLNFEFYRLVMGNKGSLHICMEPAEIRWSGR